jgi:septal ring factor EnvC (AmiA/AmiB activator)
VYFYKRKTLTEKLAHFKSPLMLCANRYPTFDQKQKIMTDIQRLEQTILDLMTTIEKLQTDIKDLKESNSELSGKLYSVNDKLDSL